MTVTVGAEFAQSVLGTALHDALRQKCVAVVVIGRGSAHLSRLQVVNDQDTGMVGATFQGCRAAYLYIGHMMLLMGHFAIDG